MVTGTKQIEDATETNTTGNPKGSRRSSQGNNATDDEMLTEVKKEEFSDGEDDMKDFDLNEDKITKEEFERAMSSQEYPWETTKLKGADEATKTGEDDDPKDQDDLTQEMPTMQILKMKRLNWMLRTMLSS